MFCSILVFHVRSLRSWRYCVIKVLAAEPRSKKRTLEYTILPVTQAIMYVTCCRLALFQTFRPCFKWFQSVCEWLQMFFRWLQIMCRGVCRCLFNFLKWLQVVVDGFRWFQVVPCFSDYARPCVNQSDISLSTMNGLVVLRAYVVLHVTKSQKSTSDIHCA